VPHPAIPKGEIKMPKVYEVGDSIVKCDNPTCLCNFSVTMYGFEDEQCTKINGANIIPLTGNTPYYCPCCGKNLGCPPQPKEK
jgi:hypothetical protein